MKFIGFYEYRMEDQQKCLERWRQRLAMGDNPDFPKVIFGPFMLQSTLFDRTTWQGFAVYETDSVDKLIALQSFYNPLFHFRFIAILENARGAEIWEKWGKK